MAGDIFDTVFASLSEQVPQILSNAVHNTLDERGIYIAHLIHEERIEHHKANWILSVYALKVEPALSIIVLRFIGGVMNTPRTLFTAEPHTLDHSIDVEIAIARLFAKDSLGI